MGGADLSAAYGFNWSTRLVASMFQLQHWPYGFNTGTAPVYLAGFRNPVGCADLSNGNACGPGRRAQHQRAHERYVRRLHAREALRRSSPTSCRVRCRS